MFSPCTDFKWTYRKKGSKNCQTKTTRRTKYFTTNFKCWNSSRPRAKNWRYKWWRQFLGYSQVRIVRIVRIYFGIGRTVCISIIIFFHWYDWYIIIKGLRIYELQGVREDYPVPCTFLLLKILVQTLNTLCSVIQKSNFDYTNLWLIFPYTI